MRVRGRQLAVLMLQVIFLFALVACGESAVEKTKYNDLTETQQKVIDNILESYSMWDSVIDGSEEIGCTNVNFFREDGKLMFATCYSLDNVGIPCIIFEVDTNTGVLSGRSYSIYEDSKKRVAIVQAYTGHTFDDSLSIEAKRDILAYEYYDAIVGVNWFYKIYIAERGFCYENR